MIKQRMTNDDYLRIKADAEDLVHIGRTDWLKRLVDTTLATMLEWKGQKTAAVAWSGGKDSLVLADLAARLQVREGVCVLTYLEYPMMETWIHYHRPAWVEIVRRPFDLPWLSRNPDMLFPQSADLSARWFSLVQHAGQEEYCQKYGIEILFLGRRAAEGNFLGRYGGTAPYTKRGVLIANPLAAWTHTDIFAYLKARELLLPPCYGWPDGFVVGTGPWPKRRRGIRTHDDGWRQLWDIDPSIVEEASAYLPTAARWLAWNGKRT